MKPLLRRLAAFLGLIAPKSYGYPAVDVQLDPQRRFHLVGSIHMGTAEMTPLPAALQQQLQQATALVVEADMADAASPFSSDGSEPPLAERLDADSLAQLKRRCHELSFSYDSLDRLPAWQAAVMLQARQAMLLGLRPGYSIDHQLITLARSQGLKIIELEGQQTQMNLLRELPQDGLPLLEDTLRHWHANAALLQIMVGWWLSNKPVRLGRLPPSTGSDVAEQLMHQRNRRWRRQLAALPAGRYVVAVGALHLYGRHSLPELLHQETQQGQPS